MNRPSFYWFEDAVEAAVLIGQQTGRKQRVFRVPGASNSWQIAPAFLRAVPTLAVHAHDETTILSDSVLAEVAKVLSRPARFGHIGGV